MNKKIEVFEVGPRDGFQSVKCTPPIATDLKLEVIDRIVAAGVRHMEYTSFVSPKAIPQLADAKEVTQAVLSKYPGLDLFALVPNLRGAQNAYELGLRAQERTIQTEYKRLEQLRAEAERKREQVVAARQETAALEKLKDKKLEDYRKMVQKGEEQFIDELVSTVRVMNAGAP